MKNLTAKEMNAFLRRIILYREQDEKLYMLNFGVYNNTMRLYIKETDIDKTSMGKLVFSLSIQPEKVRLLRELLRDALVADLEEDKNKTEFEVKLFGMDWNNKNNKPIKGSKKYLGSLSVGKVRDKKGEVINFLAVTNPTNKKFIFPFLPTPYEEYYIDGKLIENRTVLSTVKLKTFISMLDDVLSIIPELYPEVEDVNNNKQNFNSKNKKEDITNKSDDIAQEVTDSVDDLDDLI